MTLTAHARIAVAGGGLLGRLLTWQLLRRGHSVSLYEAGSLSEPKAAAWTAAGMIAPLSEVVVSERSAYTMGLYALAQWPEWLASLPAPDTGSPLFSRNGSLLVAHSQDLSELRQFEQELHHQVQDARYRRLYGRELLDLEPDLNPQFQQGLLLEDEGHLDNRNVLRALLAALTALGAELHEHTPVSLAPQCVTTERETHRYDLVLDCRGVGAKAQHSAVRGVRGEVLGVQTTEVTLQRPVRLMHPRYQLYVVPKPNHCFVIGATQIESEDLSPVSLRSSLELSSALYTLAPAFAEARIIDQGVNLRPAFMDNMPHVTKSEGLITANGLFRHGYLLAPAVVNHILAYLDGEPELPFADDLTPAPENP
ncbi:glycine oxidase ThiO [Marinimicrobium alkaliphilum]|uniref:glycine oxidase ThiO n=1 Tax=Marinimicrobium alkaliphilum TaxID=2202654 RepID=UPI000DB99A89|nr:glycine oxidase ThiO [Marinimicrobium alkaliphilum]